MTTPQIVRFDTHALNRALLGFDTMFSDFEHRFANQINNSYPPYNIVKHDDDTYEIEIAVTGFAKDEVTVEIDQNQLVVKGVRSKNSDVTAEFLHRGLAFRDFTRSWTLSEYMIVGEGAIKNGVLTIKIDRVVPEALKPRVLTIKGD
jgi:molecular chaperone IbpA